VSINVESDAVGCEVHIPPSSKIARVTLYGVRGLYIHYSPTLDTLFVVARARVSCLDTYGRACLYDSDAVQEKLGKCRDPHPDDSAWQYSRDKHGNCSYLRRPACRCQFRETSQDNIVCSNTCDVAIIGVSELIIVLNSGAVALFGERSRAGGIRNVVSLVTSKVDYQRPVHVLERARPVEQHVARGIVENDFDIGVLGMRVLEKGRTASAFRVNSSSGKTCVLKCRA